VVKLKATTSAVERMKGHDVAMHINNTLQATGQVDLLISPLDILRYRILIPTNDTFN
jgi:hypothetical protein